MSRSVIRSSLAMAAMGVFGGYGSMIFWKWSGSML
jgi:hypothetical protein